jgi:bile acid-coenzyme A ligase
VNEVMGADGIVRPVSILMPMGDLLTFHAQRDGTRSALTFGDTTMSRLDLDHAANRMARALAAEGVRQGDILSIALPTGPAFVIASFAAWKLGASPNFLSSRLVTREFAQILALLSPKLLIGGPREAVDGLSTRWLRADFTPSPALSSEPLTRAISQPWKIASSGGSTGTPKMIADTRPALLDPTEASKVLLMECDDVVLHPAPSYHNAPATQVSWALCWGSHVIQMPRFDAVEWLALVERHRVGWAYLVPTMMHRIWSLPEAVRNRHDLSSLRVVIHMAAPCPGWLKRAWIEWLGPKRIWEMYGGTEAVGGTLVSGEEWLRHPGTVGRTGSDVAIRGADGRLCAPGIVGEVVFRRNGGPSPFRYIGAAAPQGEWVGYGDIGRLDELGYLFLADRRSDMVISGGVNLYPAEIEGEIEAYPDVATCVVVGLPDADAGQVIHAIIEPRRGASPIIPTELKEFLKGRLASFKLPRSIEIVDFRLRDEAGKVRRQALRQDRMDGRCGRIIAMPRG